MLVLRRPVGMGVSIQGDDEVVTLKPERIDWYEPRVVFSFTRGALREEIDCSLGIVKPLCPEVSLCVTQALWKIVDGLPAQVIEFGISAPPGTIILRSELAARTGGARATA